MKISITINDLTTNDAQKIIAQLNSEVGLINTAPITTAATSLAAPAAPMAPLAPALPLPTAAGGEGDDDESGNAADVTGQVDTTGLPWDERIHASSKSKKADGSWTKRRGVQQPQVTAVEAELRARAPQVTAPVMPIIPNMAAFVAHPAAPAAPAPMIPAPLPPMPVAPARDMPGLITRIQLGSAAGKITPDFMAGIVQQINTAFASHGVNIVAITDVSTRADLIDYAHQILDVNQL